MLITVILTFDKIIFLSYFFWGEVRQSVHGVGMASTTAIGMRGEATMKATAELLSKNEQYLSELLSYSADRLNKEPELLKVDQNRIQRQLVETAFRNYKAFVSTAECIQKVSEQTVA